MVDRFLDGEDVAWPELRRAWRETFGGPFSGAFESSVYDRFFRCVRTACYTLGSGAYRVLLGDPPFEPRSGHPTPDQRWGMRDLRFATFEVIDFQPHERLSVRGTLASFPAQLTYVLEPGGDTTSLTNTVEPHPSGLLSVVAPLTASRVKSAGAAQRPSDQGSRGDLPALTAHPDGTDSTLRDTLTRSGP
jgi:hypothetical protein